MAGFLESAWKSPVINPIGYAHSQIFGGGGGNSSTKNVSSNQPTKPWSLTNQSQDGRNFQTTNFGYDNQGRPNALPFETIRNPDGTTNSSYQLNGGAGINLNTDAYNKYMGEATGDGMTSWGLAAMDLNKQNTTNSLNNVAGLGASTMADNMSNLQMTGGMNGAQRERVAMTGGRDMMKARMDALNQGNTQGLNIIQQDAQNKMNMLPNAQNMSLQNAQFGQDERAYQTGIDQFNVGNRLQDVSNFNNYNNNMYGEAMKGWAALKSSEAQAKAAGQQQQGGLFSFLGL